MTANNVHNDTNHHYLCKQECKGEDEKVYMTGGLILQDVSNIVANVKLRLKCYPCPVGATCDKHVQTLPNYWRFKDEIGVVTVIRCPTGYCCQNNQTCTGLDSCNIHRTGLQSGKCKANWTKSLFSPECLLIEYCLAAKIISLYILCTIGYRLCLLAFNYIKDVGHRVCKKFLISLKKMCLP